MIALPSQKVLSGRILKDATDEVSTKLLDNAKNDLSGVTLAFDGWKNVARQHIFGIVLITSTGEMIIWKAINCGGNRGTANEIIRITQQLFAELNQENIRVNGLVTDSASENASARTGVALPVNENEDPNASDDLNVSDDESSSEFIETDANVQTESNWRSVVSRWINMLEDESNEEYDNDNESDSNDDDEELEINVTNISNLPHPARDQNSKWKLQDIFIESLGEPNYLSAFILGNN
ncbi:unnamed protein product [Rhizophagus irregularis]|uniref:DUF659 domain-containing protein n=1 Tax=Rhizophagus irregularis TaxID=588596 RepID=A0A916EG90_9GLOM|nr:unnamed protein product [Rhizophagus irregularis]